MSFGAALAVTLLCVIKCCSSTLVDVSVEGNVLRSPAFPLPDCESDSSLGVRLEFRKVGLDGDPGGWIQAPGLQVTIPLNSSIVGGLQLRLLQLEHGGGQCDCWFLNTLTVNGAPAFDGGSLE
jgi:hypothetical protein